MIRWLLDTNAIIALLKGNFPHFASRVMAEKSEAFGLSVIVYHELIYGAFKSVRPEQNVQLIDAIAFPLLAFEPKDASAAGQIRGQLARLMCSLPGRHWLAGWC
jgi:tRNA(fMet)-specific endonuclease VapC